MIKKLSVLSIVLCLFFVTNVFAQQKKNDTTRNGKRSMHLVGLQANALVRQIFNFGNANNPVNNPYLLTYSFIDRKSKAGIDVGVGYTLNSIFENDGNTKKENYINDLYFRIGALKVIPLNKRFTSTATMHFLLDLLNSSTKTVSDFNSQFSSIYTNTSSLKFGLGPCLGLRYKISNRVFIGTEASYYFKMGNNKSKVTSTNAFNGQPQQTITTESDNEVKQFIFNVPTALYLSIGL